MKLTVDSVKVLVAGSACIALGAALLFLRPESEALAVALVTGGVGLLAPGAFRLGAGK